MPLNGQRIAVVGAGIGGAAVALALARRGAPISIFEQAPEAKEVGGGLQLGPNAVKVLDALGVGAEVRRIATRPQAGFFRDGLSGAQIARIPFGDVAEARYGAPYLQVHRADLLDILLKAAAEAGAGLSLSHEISTPQDLNAYDLIVGADGLKSKMRSYVVGASEPKFTGQVAWRGLVPADRLPDGLLPPAVTAFWGPYRHLVSYPLRGGALWNVVAVEERRSWTEEGWQASASVDDVRNAFAGWCAEVETLLGGLEETFLWGLFDHRPLSHWHRDNVVLLGDACHPMLPFLAQGAAMAIEDAWVLAACCDTAPVNEALARYEALRKPRTTRVQKQAAGNAGIYHAARPGLRQAKHMAVRLAATLPGGLLRRFDWLYGSDATDGMR